MNEKREELGFEVYPHDLSPLKERVDKVVSDKPSTWREEAEDRERYKELHDRIADKDLRIIELEAQINTYKIAADPCDLCRHDGKKASQMPCNICAMTGGDFVKWEPKTMEDAE